MKVVKLCRKHPDSERYSSGKCRNCVKDYNARWRAENLSSEKTRCAQWRAKNPERKKSYATQWYAKNRDRALTNTSKWNAENPERYKANVLRWKKNNYSRVLANNAKRRARKSAGMVSLTKHEIDRLTKFYAEASAMTKLTGIPHHVDHICPLSRGGLHHPDNLQVLLGLENLRKGAKLNA